MLIEYNHFELILHVVTHLAKVTVVSYQLACELTIIIGTSIFQSQIRNVCFIIILYFPLEGPIKTFANQ